MQDTPAPSLYDQYRANTLFGSLDGLRFLCITLVIWHHTPIWTELSPIFFSRGHTGVDFFFVLSGFLITTLLLREDDRTGTINLKGFYWRRILRIVPIYFLVVIVAAAYEILVRGETFALNLLPYYFLFLSNFIAVEHIGFLDPTWSLSVEEQFYLVWPALLLFLPRRWLVPALVVLISWNVAVALDVFDLIGITALEVGLLSFGIRGPTYAPILMGALIAVLLHHRSGFALLSGLTRAKLAPWALLIGLGLAYALLPDILRGWPNLVVHTLMCLMLTSLVVREDNGMAGLLQWRPIARVGQISYGMYLYHLFALALVSKAFSVAGVFHFGWWGVLVAYFCVTIVISEISFRTFEAYFMGLRKRGWGRVQTA